MSTAEPATELFTGPLGEQLRRRLEQAIAEAARAAGAARDDPGATELDRLRALIAAVSGRLAVAGGDGAAAVREHRAALARLRQRFEARFEGLAAIQSVIAELREVTSPSTMLMRAPRALCHGSRFERAILSLVRGGRMVAEAAHFAGDDAGARAVLAQLRANPPRLEHPLIETELLRRRRATIVLDAHVHPRADRQLAGLMRWRTYAAAPLIAGSQVIGVIHADRGPGRSLDVLDRDLLWEFASGLAQAYESASLRRTLRREHDEMRQLLEWLAARSALLTDAPITLARARREPPAPESLEPLAPAESRDDRIVFEGLLTRRGLDVLRLLAEGRSNRAIAAELVISGGTVKFHVNSILRKLRASNRAEAVARYLRLLGMPAP